MSAEGSLEGTKGAARLCVPLIRPWPKKDLKGSGCGKSPSEPGLTIQLCITTSLAKRRSSMGCQRRSPGQGFDRQASDQEQVQCYRLPSCSANATIMPSGP